MTSNPYQPPATASEQPIERSHASILWFGGTVAISTYVVGASFMLVWWVSYRHQIPFSFRSYSWRFLIDLPVSALGFTFAAMAIYWLLRKTLHGRLRYFSTRRSNIYAALIVTAYYTFLVYLQRRSPINDDLLLVIGVLIGVPCACGVLVAEQRILGAPSGFYRQSLQSELRTVVSEDDAEE